MINKALIDLLLRFILQRKELLPSNLIYIYIYISPAIMPSQAECFFTEQKVFTGCLIPEVVILIISDNFK